MYLPFQVATRSYFSQDLLKMTLNNQLWEYTTKTTFYLMNNINWRKPQVVSYNNLCFQRSTLHKYILKIQRKNCGVNRPWKEKSFGRKQRLRICRPERSQMEKMWLSLEVYLFNQIDARWWHNLLFKNRNPCMEVGTKNSWIISSPTDFFSNWGQKK